MLQCIVAIKLVEARIITHTESKVRTGASVVVEGLELVGDRFIESQVNVAIVSIPEFYYNDIAGIAGIAVIAGLDGNRKVDLRVEKISVFIGAFLVEFSCECYSVGLKTRECVLISAFIRDLLQHTVVSCTKPKCVEVRITLSENVRTGASVVFQG